jgi:nucleotide-binding universal stress UspA family protein
MKAIQSVTPAAPAIEIKRVLYLTDFSPASERVLPFAVSLARKHHATLEALHVLTPAIPQTCPAAVRADVELADAEMKRLRGSVTGVGLQINMARGVSVAEAIAEAIRDRHIDLIVLGTHGRTGTPRLLLGSVAEEIFRQSPVPVLTIGPHVPCFPNAAAEFHRILFATDFSSESEAAAPFAFSFADEGPARLMLLNVKPKLEPISETNEKKFEVSVTEAIRQLREIAPSEAETYNPAEVAVDYGEPGERIVAAAEKWHADLIVLGVKGAADHLGAATHIARATAHYVVTHATCPVLTVRAHEMAASAGKGGMS